MNDLFLFLTDLSKKDQVKKDSSKRKQIKKSWNRSQFIVYDLEGHNDLVTDIDSNDKILVTARYVNWFYNLEKLYVID